VTNFHLTWPPARAAALIEAWQGWAPLVPDELAASLKVTAAGEVDQPASVDVYGALLGTGSDATGLLDELVVRAGADPVLAWVRQLSFAERRRFWADLPVEEAGVGHGSHPASAQHPYLVAKSEFFTRPLRAAAAAALVENFVQGRPAGESRELDFMPWGGAFNRVPPAATALSTAMRASSSSTRPWSTPKPRPLQHKPRIGGDPLLGAGAPVGIGPGVPQLPRSGPGGLGVRLLQEQLGPPGADQSPLRPSRSLPLPPVAPCRIMPAAVTHPTCSIYQRLG
jgi:hypothetical protein